MSKGSYKRLNPYRRPATEADVNRARREGHDLGTREAYSVIFMLLMDKFGWHPEQPEPCEWCKCQWAAVNPDTGYLEHREAKFCPECGRPIDGRDNASLIALWAEAESLATQINLGKVRLKDVNEVLESEYEVQVTD